jgi:hypothetical protein
MDKFSFKVLGATFALTSLIWLVIILAAVIGVNQSYDKKNADQLRQVFERGALFEVARTNPPAQQCAMGEDELRCFATKSGKAHVTTISMKESK